MRSLARHLRTNTVAYLAIFVALGGTSYAAIAIPNNSVGNKQLKKDAVDSKKVKNKTLLKDDFNASSLPAGPKGPDGALGEKGPQGSQGLKGDKGDGGDKGLTGDQGAPGADIKSVTDSTGAPVVGENDTVMLQAPALETAAPTRLHGNATANFSGDDDVVDCVIKVSSDGGAKVAMGQRVSLPITTLGFPAYPAPGAASGSLVVPAGSHVVTYECKDFVNGTADFLRGDLTVSKAAP